MTFRIRHLFVLLYLAIGIFVAWSRGYLGVGFLRGLASALLAIFLWWLTLLGVNLHVH
jgi:membrane-associated phospholipid phosphatase